MVRIFGVALGGREDYFERFTDHSIDVLRMNNYRLPDPGAELEPDQLGMGAHTDYGIVTVLWADQVPGLEIHCADGNWHPVCPPTARCSSTWATRRPAGRTRSGSPPCTASPRRGSTAPSCRGAPPPTSTTATWTR